MSLFTMLTRVSEIDNTSPATVATNTVFAGVVGATVLNWLPQIIGIVAASTAFIWYIICIWESRTIQHYINNRRMVVRARKIARLKAQEKVITAKLDALEVVRQAKVEAKEKVAQATALAEVLKVKEEIAAQIKLPPV